MVVVNQIDINTIINSYFAPSSLVSQSCQSVVLSSPLACLLAEELKIFIIDIVQGLIL